MKRLIPFLFAFVFFLTSFQAAFAQVQTNKELFMQGQIQEVVSEQTTIADGGLATLTQNLRVKVLDGPQKNKMLIIQQGNDARVAAFHKYASGQTVVIDETIGPDGRSHYAITDTYRIPSLIFITLGFFLFTIAVVGKKGAGAIGGLTISLAVILLYIIPQILYNQQDPLTVSLIGSCVILFVTTFLAHGFSRQTAIAIASTFLALIATYLFSISFVQIAHLLGLGTEDSYLLELNPAQPINPKGLLLGGIVIGTLGALNDITTTQVASVFALFKANSTQTFFHLIEHGFSIGREHIASLVNTLVLAYAGTSLPIFIFLIINPQHLPLWVLINNEAIAQEIVRTIAGSCGLILAVPIATLLAAYLAPKFSNK